MDWSYHTYQLVMGYVEPFPLYVGIFKSHCVSLCLSVHLANISLSLSLSPFSLPPLPSPSLSSFQTNFKVCVSVEGSARVNQYQKVQKKVIDALEMAAISYHKQVAGVKSRFAVKKKG